MPASGAPTEHFEGKDAIQHVVEHHADGLLSAAEVHGQEIPGHVSAGACAAREAGVLILLIWTILNHFQAPPEQIALFLASFGGAFLVWRIGRSSLIEWSRLERLHRVIDEERWEIQHNRAQEREELRALYSAKGFEGELLEEVLDVLMSDNDRLLRVMLEEELGLRLHSNEHPLKQGIGAGIGVSLALVIFAACYFLIPTYGMLVGGLLVVGTASLIAAWYEKNKMIPAFLWTVGLAVMTYGMLDFLLNMIAVD